MGFLARFLLLFVVLSLELFAEKIETFYGEIDVEEPVLIELIQSPAFQRLKWVRQYGVSYYTSHREEYTRYEHSLGVFTILKLKGASLEEQIAGLLHDVSHTAFSHVGDWVFGKENKEDDYQHSIHQRYLVASGLEAILNRYGFTSEQVLPDREVFAMLEQPLPNLCADRIDYNIQGAYYQNFLTREEALELLQDLFFQDGRWLITRTDLAAKLTRFSLFMTEDCWGSAINHVTSRWLADAILQGLKINLVSWEDFHFGTDEEIWNRLLKAEDPLIQTYMQMLSHPHDYYRVVGPDQANIFVKFKSRGIDPWIIQEGRIARLTSIDAELQEAFSKTKEKSLSGWPLEIRSLCNVN